MGLRTFSMAPKALPAIKRLIRSITLEKAEEVAQRVLAFETEREVINYLREVTRKVAPDLL
jgi:phosphotransferase system enzyme I (PtsI)